MGGEEHSEQSQPGNRGHHHPECDPVLKRRNVKPLPASFSDPSSVLEGAAVDGDACDAPSSGKCAGTSAGKTPMSRAPFERSVRWWVQALLVASARDVTEVDGEPPNHARQEPGRLQSLDEEVAGAPPALSAEVSPSVCSKCACACCWQKAETLL